MIRTEVNLLEMENEKQLKELREDDEQIIKDIMKSMSIFKVNSYDAQVIRRDLIGMAQELKLRDSSLKDAIGDDLKGFTNEIIRNGGGPCKREILLNFLSKLFAYFCGWSILSIFTTSGKLIWKLSPTIYLFYAGFVIILFITEGILEPIFSTEKGLKKNLHSLISLLLFAALGFVNYLLRDSQQTTEINGGLIIGVTGVAFLIIKYLNSKNINRLAKEKKNYIDDLI